jgi:hypothetical protein
MAGFGTGLTQGVQATTSLLDTFQKQKQLALRQQEAGISQGKLDLEKRQSEVEYGVPGSDKPGLAERRVKLTEDQQRRVEQTAEAGYYRGLQLKPVKTAALFTGIVKKIPETGKVLQPILDAINADQIKTRAELRTVMMQANATGQFAPIRESLLEKATKTAEAGKNGEAAGYLALYENTSPDNFEEFVDDIMGKPAHMKRSAQERGLGVKPRGPQETFGEKVWDKETQSWLQQDSTGKWHKVVQAGTKASQRSLRFNPETGEFEMIEGPEMTTKVKGELESRVVDQEDQRIRVENIINNFNADFLTVEGKAKATLIDLKGKLLKGSVTEADRQYMNEFATFAQDTVENVNLYIHMLTGAQMSKSEAGRLMLGVPNMGRTWFTGDGPDKFRAKMMNSWNKTKAASARYQYYLEQGLTPGRIRAMINDGKAAPLARFESKDQDQDTISGMSDEAIKAELGIK